MQFYHITGTICGKSVRKLRKFLSSCDTDGISICLDSFGGNPDCAAEMAGMLDMYLAPKYLYCYGSVDSSALDILGFVGWDHVTSHPLTSFTFHQSGYGNLSASRYTMKDFQEMIDSLKDINDNMVSKWSDLLKTEVGWVEENLIPSDGSDKLFNAFEMLNMGLIDTIGTLGTLEHAVGILEDSYEPDVSGEFED